MYIYSFKQCKTRAPTKTSTASCESQTASQLPWVWSKFLRLLQPLWSPKFLMFLFSQLLSTVKYFPFKNYLWFMFFVRKYIIWYLQFCIRFPNKLLLDCFCESERFTVFQTVLRFERAFLHYAIGHRHCLLDISFLAFLSLKETFCKVLHITQSVENI